MKPSNNTIGQVLLFIGLLSAVIIIKTYFDDRSMFLDEINLSRNIIELDYSQLVSNLKYEQHAPPAYLFLQKTISNFFGATHYAFRILSLLAVLLGLFLFIKIVMTRLELISQIFCVTLFGLSTLLIRYGTEAKQYGLDILFSILILYLGFKVFDTNKRNYILITIIGVIGIWFSMPIVFALSGLGLAMMIHQYSLEKNVFKECIIISLWLISFGFLYFLSLSPSLDNEVLNHFHSQYFFGNDGDFGNQIVGLFSMLVGKTAIPIGFAMILFLLGIIHLLRTSVKLLVLLAFPIFAMLIVSAFGYYSLITRMVVFLIPNFLIIIGFGLQSATRFVNSKPIPKYMLYAVGSLVLVNFLVKESALTLLTNPLKTEEGRPAIAFAAQYNYPLYISHSAYPFYSFYSRLIDDPIIMEQKHFKGQYQDDILLLQSWINEYNVDTLIVLDIHTFGKEKATLSSRLNQIGALNVIRKLKAAEVAMITSIK